jgi:glycosyltransferase involved in cell wall biosynthesis
VKLATVVIRAKDEAASIGRTLSLLAEQDVAKSLETIVVDSGSRDATVSIARDAQARVVQIQEDQFTFGRALNRGCDEASSDIVIALSAHAFPPDTSWVRRMLAAFDDDRVACACGYEVDPNGLPLTERRLQDAEDLRRYPLWGYTNASGAFRRGLWKERPFREDMPGTEDKEWAAHWVAQGYLAIVDPTLSVHHSHHHDGPLLTFRRSRREWEGFAMYLELPRYRITDVWRDWWKVERGTRRAGWRRTAALAGEWSGRRRGRAR